ncbi:hypothetical protein TKK_0012440 [Trichogramma kaykai]
MTQSNTEPDHSSEHSSKLSDFSRSPVQTNDQFVLHHSLDSAFNSVDTSCESSNNPTFIEYSSTQRQEPTDSSTILTSLQSTARILYSDFSSNHGMDNQFGPHNFSESVFNNIPSSDSLNGSTYMKYSLTQSQEQIYAGDQYASHSTLSPLSVIRRHSQKDTDEQEYESKTLTWLEPVPNLNDLTSSNSMCNFY